MNNGAPIDPTNQSTIPSMPQAPGAEPKKSNASKTLLIVMLAFSIFIVLFFAVLIVGVFSIRKSAMDGDSLICESGDNYIQIYYDENGVHGINRFGTYFDNYQLNFFPSYLENYSTTEEGLIAFGEEIMSTKNGAICELNGKSVLSYENTDSTDNTKPDELTNNTNDARPNETTNDTTINIEGSSSRLIGSPSLGYLDIPLDWLQRETGENDAISYGNDTEAIYISTRNGYSSPDKAISALESSLKEDPNVTNISFVTATNLHASEDYFTRHISYSDQGTGYHQSDFIFWNNKKDIIYISFASKTNAEDLEYILESYREEL